MGVGRKPIDFCLRGHEIALVGRYTNGNCRACHLRKDDPPAYTPGRPGRRPVNRIKKPATIGRPRVERCARGHDLNQTRYVWRGKVKGCSICRARRNDERVPVERRLVGPRMSSAKVPADPIWAFVEKVGVKAFAQNASAILGVKPESVQRMLWRGRTNGFTIGTADDLCVAIGRHPVELFGPEWFNYGREEVADAV